MLFSSLKPAVLAAATLLPALSFAQVTTDCDPLKKDCPADPAFATDKTFDFTSKPNGGIWEKTAGFPEYLENEGARFQITKKGESTTIQMKYYFFFGRTELHLKAASGQGIISSMMWISDCLDEVDWEFLGSKPTEALSNYFGKGNQDSADGQTHVVPDIVNDYHNYTTVWTQDKLEWWMDGNLLRTVKKEEAAVIDGKSHFPQTPMRIRLGIWAGGDPDLPEGTREWAGGDTDYSAGPYYMYVKSAQVTDYSSGKEYVYGDKSGDWESINVVKGTSKVEDVINQKPQEEEEEKSLTEKFKGLSTGAKIGIAAGVGGAILLAIIAFAVYFFKQRRRGATEAALAARRAEAERVEMEGFKARGIDPDSFAERGGADYNPQGAQAPNAGAGFLGSNTAYSALPDEPVTPYEKNFGQGPRRGNW